MPSIYVASLSDYVAGMYHGVWIELDEDTDTEEVRDEIADMLKASPNPDAEEFAIHDYEGFGSVRLSEWEQIERVVLLSHLVAEHGEGMVSAYVNCVVGDHTSFSADDIGDSYEGKHGSPEEFAQSLIIDEGLGYRSLSPDQAKELADVLDWDAIANDLSDTFQYVEHGGHVFVFQQM
jgi:antirestriction protein